MLCWTLVCCNSVASVIVALACDKKIGTIIKNDAAAAVGKQCEGPQIRRIKFSTFFRRCSKFAAQCVQLWLCFQRFCTALGSTSMDCTAMHCSVRSTVARLCSAPLTAVLRVCDSPVVSRVQCSVCAASCVFVCPLVCAPCAALCAARRAAASHCKRPPHCAQCAVTVATEATTAHE